MKKENYTFICIIKIICKFPEIFRPKTSFEATNK